MEKVGQISFDGHILEVYDSLDAPYFLGTEVAKLIDYSTGNTAEMLRMLEQDEHLLVTLQRAGQHRQVRMITELGLYSILSQSNKPIARKWQRVVHSNLILLRRQKNLMIDDQFDIWAVHMIHLYYEFRELLII